jgi:hypothetical protein
MLIKTLDSWLKPPRFTSVLFTQYWQLENPFHTRTAWGFADSLDSAPAHIAEFHLTSAVVHFHLPLNRIGIPA